MKSKTIQEFKETEIGNIPADWKIKKINDLYEIRSGLSKPRDQFGFGYPFLSFKEIFENFSLPDKLENLVNSSEKERESGSIKRGDVFLTRTSETWEQLGMSSVALKDYENATFNGFAKRLRPINNEFILPEFAAYLFRSPKIQTQFSTYSNLTTRASLNGEAIKQVLLTIPTRKEQEKISKSLSDLTIKISNLQNQNRILEEMAQAIFQSWFVDFDGVTEFEDSELGKIPKGWQVGTFSDVIAELESGRRPKGGINSSDTEIPSIGAENIIGLGKYNYLKTKFVSSDFFNVMKDGKIKENDVLLYKDGASLGRSSLFRNGFPFQKCCINEHVFILRPSEKISSSFLFFWIDQDFMKQEIINLNSNSAQPGINKPGVLSLPILIPEININKKFRILIEPLLTKFFKNILNCNQLTKTLDALLPKLMSGEIRV